MVAIESVFASDFMASGLHKEGLNWKTMVVNRISSGNKYILMLPKNNLYNRMSSGNKYILMLPKNNLYI